MPELASNLERLRALFLEHFHVDVPDNDTDLLETGALDSLQLVDLLLLIEQHFGQRIPIESIDLDNLRTLGRLAQLLGAAGDSRVADHGELASAGIPGPLGAAQCG